MKFIITENVKWRVEALDKDSAIFKCQHDFGIHLNSEWKAKEDI